MDSPIINQEYWDIGISVGVKTVGVSGLMAQHTQPSSQTRSSHVTSLGVAGEGLILKLIMVQGLLLA